MSGVGAPRLSGSGQPSPWRLVGFALLVLCAWLSAMPLEGQTSNASEPLTSIQLLTQAEQLSLTLQTRLAERRQQVTSLQASLQQAGLKVADLQQALAESEGSSATLANQLAEAQDSVAKLQTDLTETQNSLAASSTQYESVSQGWRQYREYARSEYARLTLQRNLWAVGRRYLTPCSHCFDGVDGGKIGFWDSLVRHVRKEIRGRPPWAPLVFT